MSDTTKECYEDSGCSTTCVDYYDSDKVTPRPYCYDGNGKCLTQTQWDYLVYRGYVTDVQCDESGETDSATTDLDSGTDETIDETISATDDAHSGTGEIAPECGEDYYDEDPCGTGLKCDEDSTSDTHQTCLDYDFFEDAEPGDSEFSVITAQASDNID